MDKKKENIKESTAGYKSVWQILAIFISYYFFFKLKEMPTIQISVINQKLIFEGKCRVLMYYFILTEKKIVKKKATTNSPEVNRRMGIIKTKTKIIRK